MARPWLLRMRWLDLVFAHWPVAPESIRPLIPASLEIETYEGMAWIGVVPFVMADVAPRGLPAIPRFSRFPEVNVRTYVRHGDLPGVWFFSLDAASRPTVWGGRAVFHLPYHHATMRAKRDPASGFVRHLARRRGGDVRFAAQYRPSGPAERSAGGSFDEWSTERRRLFAVDRHGVLWRTEIEHEPWRLQAASGFVAGAGLARAAGIELPDEGLAPLRFSSRLDVRGWPPVRA